jgi:hypothetical protein
MPFHWSFRLTFHRPLSYHLRMRSFLVILLIVMFPLRAFASLDMQTSMGVMALHQAAAKAADSAVSAPSLQDDTASTEPTPMDCCAQCSVCDLCHLLIGQTPTANVGAIPLFPQVQPQISVRFASADRRTAHKPPLALI